MKPDIVGSSVGAGVPRSGPGSVKNTSYVMEHKLTSTIAVC